MSDFNKYNKENKRKKVIARNTTFLLMVTQKKLHCWWKIWFRRNHRTSKANLFAQNSGLYSLVKKVSKLDFIFRFTISLRNLTIRFRNSNAELYDYRNVWVYAIQEESDTSASGRICECLDGQMATSAVEWQMTFMCSIDNSTRISVHFHQVCTDDDLGIEVCEVYGN